MQPYLDLRSLLFMASFVSLGLFLCMLYVSSTRRVYPGFHCWTAASLFYFLGNIMTGLRNELPPFVTIILANALIIAVFLMIPYGITLFADRKPSWRNYLTALIIPLVPFFYFTYTKPNIVARILIISAVILVCCIYALILFRNNVVPILGRSNFLIQASLLTMITWTVIRGFLSLLVEGKVECYLQSSPIQAISIIIYSTGFISGCFSFFIINFQKLELDHSNVSAELKGMGKLMPICTFCKKIRDDQGYWDQIEAYLSTHSDTKFSHSICPDCFTKHYDEDPE